MVSMFPFVDDRLYRIEGGNYRLAVELLKYAAAKLHQPAEVAAVERQTDGRWRVSIMPDVASTCSTVQVSCSTGQ